MLEGTYRSSIGRVVRTRLASLGALAVLTACTSGTADQLVEVATTRVPAVVGAANGSGRCPSDTVLLDDPDSGSGAGAIPAEFNGRVLLRCEVDYTTMTTRNGVDRFTVRQWQGDLTAELQKALALPDREPRSNGAACGAGRGGTTALYVVNARDQIVRVLPPKDGPCHDIRSDLEALLPDTSSPARQTFRASRKAS